MFKNDRIIFKPNKSLGQNFLFDKILLDKISEICIFKSSFPRKIIEVGPGYGSLTSFLIEKLNKKNEDLFCFEKDKKLFEFLKEKFFNFPNIKIIFEDALEINWKKFFEEIKKANIINKEDFYFNIVGNIPYNISNKLIFNIFNQSEYFESVVFLVQKEVAQRWVANPFLNKEYYSYLSLLVSYFSEALIEINIPKSSFYPIPKVDGSLVSLKIKRKRFFSCKKKEKKFLIFTKNCFKFRRKTLINNIKDIFEKDKIKNILNKLSYNKNVRPQDLSLNEYFVLYEEIFKL